MKYLIGVFTFMNCVLNINAQQTIKVSSTLINRFNQPIKEATILVNNATDSSLFTSAFSDKKGFFSFYIDKGTDFYCTIIKDSFKTKVLPLLKDKPFLPDSLFLENSSTDNDVVTIVASPIIVKEDTIQFNNEMFKKDSLKTLEEILLKFPGVTIDREGNIEIHGVKVKEILLEGKPLPFNDIKLLTQTLQAAAIDKIQFIDRKSEEARISKIDDGQRDKVINIKLKSKTKKSLNQSYYAGLGNTQRYEARANINFMYNNFYSNVFVNYSNTGRNNYNSIAFFNPTGISKGISSGLNFRVSSNKKLTIGVNLNQSDQNTELNQLRDRVIFLKDSLNYYNQQFNSVNNNKSYSLNSDINFVPDTLGEWRMRLSGSFGKSLNTREESFTTKSHSKQSLNAGMRNNDGTTHRYNYNIYVNGGRRNLKNTLSVLTNASFSESNSDDETIQLNDILYFRTTSVGYDTTHQKIINKNRNKSFSFNVNANIQLVKNIRLSIGTGVQYTNRPIQRDAYYYNTLTGVYEIPNTALLNDAVNLTNTFSQKIGLTYEAKDHSFNVGINRNQQLNESRDIYRDTTIEQRNQFYTPYLSYNYNSKKILINQSLTVSQRTPTSQELQPIVDNTNPLFIRRGNPELRNQQTISLSTSFQTKQNNKNKNSKAINLSANNNFTLINNKIANYTFFDVTEGKQTSRPINLPQIFNNVLSFNMNRYFEKIKMNLYHRFTWSIGKDNNYLNGELNNLNNNSLRPAIGIKLNRKKYYFDYNIGYLYQTNKYSLRPNQNIKIGNFTTDANITLLMIKNTEVRLDYQQTVNNNKRSIQRINNLNGRVEYLFKMKRMKPRLAFQVFDILNQNNNLQQNINDYYEETVFTNAIRRFYLISLQVSINQFKTGKNSMKKGKKNP